MASLGALTTTPTLPLPARDALMASPERPAARGPVRCAPSLARPRDVALVVERFSSTLLPRAPRPVPPAPRAPVHRRSRFTPRGPPPPPPRSRPSPRGFPVALTPSLFAPLPSVFVAALARSSRRSFARTSPSRRAASCAAARAWRSSSRASSSASSAYPRRSSTTASRTTASASRTSSPPPSTPRAPRDTRCSSPPIPAEATQIATRAFVNLACDAARSGFPDAPWAGGGAGFLGEVLQCASNREVMADKDPALYATLRGSDDALASTLAGWRAAKAPTARRRRRRW